MIRAATIEDLDSIVAIYNQAIDAGFQTGFTEKWEPGERIGWLQGHLTGTHPIFVYIADGMVAGWFSISPYRAGRAAFRYTVEISYFVHSRHQKKGIGPQLVAYGINACRQLDYKTAIAIILDKNDVSVKLIEKFGFEQWGFMPGIADFSGVECNHLYYGLKL